MLCHLKEDGCLAIPPAYVMMLVLAMTSNCVEISWSLFAWLSGCSDEKHSVVSGPWNLFYSELMELRSIQILLFCVGMVKYHLCTTYSYLFVRDGAWSWQKFVCLISRNEIESSSVIQLIFWNFFQERVLCYICTALLSPVAHLSLKLWRLLSFPWMRKQSIRAMSMFMLAFRNIQQSSSWVPCWAQRLISKQWHFLSSFTFCSSFSISCPCPPLHPLFVVNLQLHIFLGIIITEAQPPPTSLSLPLFKV